MRRQWRRDDERTAWNSHAGPQRPGHQHISRLDVAVNDPFLVCVLNCLADKLEKLEPLSERSTIAIALFRDGDAVDELHDKEGTTELGRAGVEELGDRGMVHEASACRSASNRAMNWAESIPGLITLSAAVRRTGAVCSARKTTPMPPSPICSISVYGPTTDPARSDIAG